MAILQSATLVKPSLGFNVGCVRDFWAIEQPDMMKRAVSFQARSPLPRLWVEVNTKKAALVVFSWVALVLRILGWGREPKVADPVVASVAVDVIDEVGPDAVRVQPSQSMGLVHASINADHDIPTSDYASASSGFVTAVTTDSDSSCEDARVRVVFEKLAQSRASKFNHISAF
jgi:hypothetical protein